MKLKNSEAFDALHVIIGAKETGKLGFALAKNGRKLSEELVEYNDKRDELLEKYGKNNGGGEYSLTNEAARKFNDELQVYGSLEIEFEPMTVEEEVFYGGNLTADQMYVLMWMVKE